jgi:hypothetical protein
VTDSASPVELGLTTVMGRAAVFAAFIICLSLIGEAVLVFALQMTSGHHVLFTTFWAFAVSSGLLGYFPATYSGGPLGYGLSRLCGGNRSVAMTRTTRLAVFLMYLVLVLALSGICEVIQNHLHLRNDIDVNILFPSWFLMTSIIAALSNWRQL